MRRVHLLGRTTEVIGILTEMAGLVKAKKYDWKDSNLALFGSDTERQVWPYTVGPIINVC